MRKISININDDLYKDFSTACSKLRSEKESVLVNLIKEFIEDYELSKLAKERLKDLKSGKTRLLKHAEIWK